MKETKDCALIRNMANVHRTLAEAMDKMFSGQTVVSFGDGPGEEFTNV
jgi:hypothetical protein